jgi:hypothetical protein
MLKSYCGSRSVTMSTIEPVYIESNCNFAFQLRWGLTIFWQKSVDEKYWFEALVEHLAPQGIRILSWRSKRANVSLFSLSTVPIVSPSCIVEQVREHLQSICERISPSSLRTRFASRSFGTHEWKIVEAYVAKQPRLPSMDPRSCPTTNRPEVVSLIVSAIRCD